jgi:hypothetical protein
MNMVTGPVVMDNSDVWNWQMVLLERINFTKAMGKGTGCQ